MPKLQEYPLQAHAINLNHRDIEFGAPSTWCYSRSRAYDAFAAVVNVHVPVPEKFPVVTYDYNYREEFHLDFLPPLTIAVIPPTSVVADADAKDAAVAQAADDDAGRRQWS